MGKENVTLKKVLGITAEVVGIAAVTAGTGGLLYGITEGVSAIPTGNHCSQDQIAEEAAQKVYDKEHGREHTRHKCYDDDVNKNDLLLRAGIGIVGGIAAMGAGAVTADWGQDLRIKAGEAAREAAREAGLEAAREAGSPRIFLEQSTNEHTIEMRRDVPTALSMHIPTAVPMPEPSVAIAVGSPKEGYGQAVSPKRDQSARGDYGF